MAAEVSTVTVTIELACEADFEEVDRVIREAYAHDYGPSTQGTARPDPMLFASGRAEQFNVWVARDEHGMIVGSVTTRRAGGPSLHEDALPHELDLRLVGVSPSARRRGIAAQLMRHVTEHAGEVGFTGVFFKTAPHMTPAHHLYDALGFIRAHDRDGLWIGGEKQFDLFSYVMPLEGSPA